MEKGLLEKTGKSLDHWINVVKQSGIEKHSKIIAYLKSEFGFTHGYANFVSLKARKSDAASHSNDDLLQNQYRGKEQLIPIYEALKKVALQWGDEVTITPKKDSVSFIRKKQFMLVKPATKSRVDLGLKLKGKEQGERLEGSGPFGAMCTHRVRLEKPEEVDDELKAWILEAFEKAD